MLPYLQDNFANPSSAYSFGNDIKKRIEEVQDKVAKLLNSKSKEIIFTSGATESNVTAVMSAVRSNPDKRHIVTTKIEHASILETLKYLESVGYEVTYLDVDEKGRIDLKKLEKSIREDTCLISIMAANNEIGNIYPLKKIGEIANRHDVLFHVDATQAIGKIKIDVEDMSIDMLSFSGHKLYAPKGIGVLYVRETINFVPLLFGHQQEGRRGGTENTPYIIGLGKAIDLLESNDKIEELKSYMEDRITTEIEDTHLYGDLDNRVPNTTSIAFKGVNPDELMLLLESFGIYVSTGSACNSSEVLPSYVLTSMNADLDNYRPIRVSLGKHNTKEEIDEFIKVLSNSVKTLRRTKDNK
ncbi:MAG TPA: cysteine desulfurase NifS [Firmicutes bacterium]|nr:cysteine desulfurase NifS [Bacillota bacterium]